MFAKVLIERIINLILGNEQKPKVPKLGTFGSIFEAKISRGKKVPINDYETVEIST